MDYTTLTSLVSLFLHYQINTYILYMHYILVVTYILVTRIALLLIYFIIIIVRAERAQLLQRWAMGYGLNDRGSIPVTEIFAISQHPPNLPWGPPDHSPQADWGSFPQG
jgi:hypothetical protein